MSSYRPRRTRIYGANYDIGESYYKKQLQNLENKRLGVGSSRLASEPPTFSNDFLKDEHTGPKVSFAYADDDIGFKIKKKPSLLERSHFNDLDDDEEFSSIRKRITSKFSAASSAAAASAAAAGVEDEYKFGEGLKRDIFKRKPLDIPTKEATPFLSDTDCLVNNGFEKTSRRLKLRSENISSQESKVHEDTSSRMKATRARLADLESEMLNISEKNMEREQRKHNLRKLLSGNDDDMLTF